MPKPKKKPAALKTPSPFQRPKSGDKSDVRCAFVLDRKGRHDLGKKPDGAWCFGCEFYICDDCDSPFGLSGKHDVAEHDPADDDL